jgi:hypothetical protein
MKEKNRFSPMAFSVQEAASSIFTKLTSKLALSIITLFYKTTLAMKNLIVILFISCTTLLNAQDAQVEPINYGNRIQKGTILLTGSMGYNRISQGDESNSSFFVDIAGIYALSERVGVGIFTGYSSGGLGAFMFESFSVDDAFQVGPMLRVFGNTHWGWLQPFGELRVPLGFASTNLYDYTSIGANIRPGVTVFLSRTIALEASLGVLGYNSISRDGEDDNYDSFDFGFDMNNLRFGMVFLMGAR